MLRIRIGESWTQNPRYVGALRALAEGRSRGFSPRDIVDVLGIEVDGVDLAEGLGEAALLDSLRALVRAARTVATGGDTARVTFTGGRLELDLRREEGDVHVELRKPIAGGVRVAHAFTLPPKDLLNAVNAAARSFLTTLAEIHPALATQRTVRALDAELARPPRRQPARRSLEPRFASEAALGEGRLALRADRRALVFVDAAGEIAWTLPGAHALDRLRSVLAGRGEAPGVELDRSLATVRFGRAPPVSLATTRAAIAELGAQVPETIDDFEPEQPPTPLVVTGRRRPAVPREVPTDGLRRLHFRPAWRVDAVEHRPRVFPTRAGIVLRTHGHTELRRADGSLAWRSSVGDATLVHLDDGEALAARDSHGALVVLDATTGARRARLPAILHGALRSGHALDGQRVAVNDGQRLACVSLGGDRPWTYEGGGGDPILTAAERGAVVVGEAGGELVGLSATGAIAWRAQSGIEELRWLRIDTGRQLVLAGGLDGRGHVLVAAVALADGTIRWHVPIDGVRPGEPALGRGRVCVPYDASAGPAVSTLDVASGRLRWTVVPEGDGPAAIALGGDALFIARCGGGLEAYSPAGRRRLACPPRDPDPALSPARPRPPLVAGGLAVAPAAFIHVFEATSGRSVASLEPGELAAESVAILPGPTIVAAGREGLVEAWRASGHLRVV